MDVRSDPRDSVFTDPEAEYSHAEAASLIARPDAVPQDELVESQAGEEQSHEQDPNTVDDAPGSGPPAPPYSITAEVERRQQQLPMPRQRKEQAEAIMLRSSST